MLRRTSIVRWQSAGLQHFDIAYCREVLRAVYSDYGELMLSPFDPVAANADDCAFACCDMRGLEVGARVAR